MKLGSAISAVVTGGASGLGAATARALASKGVRVALFDLDRARGEAVATEIGAVFCEVDVTSDASVAAGFEAARAANGQERILVNCAGIAPAARTLSRSGPHSTALFEKVILVNLGGTFRCLSQAAAGMAGLEPVTASGERGVAVSTASVAAFDGQIGQAAYAASKGGVAALTLPAARDLSQNGIRVMTIAPGIFETPMLAALPAEVQESLGRQVPFPSRLGRPEEYAALVAHICENEMLNGETIRLDGAIRMAPR
jgi:NAD(P)-dependent dehydrogenase (short-subunit alcohol dehydrogenase family)